MLQRTCHILVYRLYEGDAVSRHTFDLARVAADLGMRPAIFSSYGLGDLPADIRPIARTTDYAGYTGGADLTILQYPLWFPLAERFRTIDGAAIFWYHGVTPPALWPQSGGRDLLETSQIRTDLAQCAHLAVANSPFIAAELQRSSGYPADRLRVAPLGIDIARYAVQPDPAQLAALRKQWRLEGRRVLLYIGRIAGNKRIDLLVDALSLLAPAYPDLHLLVVGNTQDGVVTQELTASLRRQAAERGVARRVTFTGRVPDVAPYYRLAHVYLQASQHEGFGAPLVEAMAAGAPVIASADGSLPWLLGADGPADAAAGLIFASGNAAELARNVERLLVEPDLRERLIDRGRQRAQRFSIEAFRLRAAAILCEALELAQQAPAPVASLPLTELHQQADTALRGYRVGSRLPLLGQAEAALRSAATTHLKEAYFDRIVERQVNFNRRLAGAIHELDQELRRLEQKIGTPDATDRP